MARDRQRAKQRRARRAAQPDATAGNRLHRENVPGELDHLSGGVEQFEAALVAGSGGQPVEEEIEPGVETELAPAVDSEVEEELDPRAQDVAEPAAAGASAAPATVPAPARPAGRSRAIAFLRASWSELQRVQWPDRRQVAQATAVVLGFVIVAGAYLGLADAVAQRIVDFIL